MTAPDPIPWLPPAIRQLLLADAAFTAACEGRVSTRLPSTVTFCAQIRVPGLNATSGDGVAWSPLVQVDGWCAPGIPGVDPEQKAWDIAALAGRILGRARNITIGTMSYSGRLVEGPLPDVDTSRGESSPLYRAIIRAELYVQMYATP